MRCTVRCAPYNGMVTHLGYRPDAPGEVDRHTLQAVRGGWPPPILRPPHGTHNGAGQVCQRIAELVHRTVPSVTARDVNRRPSAWSVRGVPIPVAAHETALRASGTAAPVAADMADPSVVQALLEMEILPFR